MRSLSGRHTASISAERTRVVIVLMGVAGVGKTTVGRRLAHELGWPFHDADDFHPPENIARMRSGVPLGEAERAPWLAALAQLIGDHARRGESMVLACSALRRAHRVALLSATPEPSNVRLVLLQTDGVVLSGRLNARSGHFFPADLLDTQLETLEAPDDRDTVPVLVLDAALSIDDLVTAIRGALDV
jgi:gluconokinase